ncbi:hypothetical protein BDV59DRAFT_196793 [Aspergillus ambiguus]|uniref:uncharacterized protein n=1 Tax=Aspergillus ambiguus TaxID=176160 RepID=UPI003CCDE3C8
MIIDEVSMIDLSTLSTINSHCKSARSLVRTSPDLFGGLPIVILMGDFYQFPPVRGQPLRHVINRHQTENFALIRHQTIFVFPALHSRARSSGQGNLKLRADDLLHVPDQVMLLTNINTPAGLVNGATGTAVGVVLDPTGKLPHETHLYIISLTRLAELYTLNDHYVFCNKPPAFRGFGPLMGFISCSQLR